MHEKTLNERVMRLEKQLEVISHKLEHVEHEQEHIMSKYDEVTAVVAAEKEQVRLKMVAVDAEIQALKDQIAAGGGDGATSAQLDILKAAIEEIFTPGATTTPLAMRKPYRYTV